MFLTRVSTTAILGVRIARFRAISTKIQTIPRSLEPTFRLKGEGVSSYVSFLFSFFFVHKKKKYRAFPDRALSIRSRIAFRLTRGFFYTRPD